MKKNQVLKRVITFLVILLCVGNSAFAASNCRLATVLPSYAEIKDSLCVYVYKVASLTENGQGYVKEAGFVDVSVDLDGATASKLAEYGNQYAEVAVNAAKPVGRIQIGQTLEAEWLTEGIYFILVCDGKETTPSIQYMDGARGKNTAVTVYETKDAKYAFLPEIITLSKGDAFGGNLTGENAVEIKCEKFNLPSKDDGGNGNPGNPEDGGSGVTTGDAFSVRIVLWVSAISAAIFILIVLVRRKKQENTGKQ